MKEELEFVISCPRCGKEVDDFFCRKVVGKYYCFDCAKIIEIEESSKNRLQDY